MRPNGLNTYAAYHVMWGGVDPMGLSIDDIKDGKSFDSNKELMKYLHENDFYPEPVGGMQDLPCTSTFEGCWRYVLKSSTGWVAAKPGLFQVNLDDGGSTSGWGASASYVSQIASGAVQVARGVPARLPVGGIVSPKKLMGMEARYVNVYEIELRYYDCDGYCFSHYKEFKSERTKTVHLGVNRKDRVRIGNQDNVTFILKDLDRFKLEVARMQKRVVGTGVIYGPLVPGDRRPAGGGCNP